MAPVHIGGSARVAAVVAAVALALGTAAVGAVDDVLAVSFAAKDELVAADRDGAPVLQPAVAPARVGLDVPAPGDPLVDLAVEHVRTALRGAGAEAVALEAPAPGTAPPDVLRASLDPAAATGTPDSYVLAREAGAVAVTAGDRRGLAAGLFQLADHLAAGRGWRDVEAGPRIVAPALERRFVDTGALGVTPDPQAWAAQDDYVHASGALNDVVLAQDPWLDPDALAEVDAQWRTYVDRMVSYGYDGVVVPGFLEYVTFAGVEGGDAVYPPGSPYRERAAAMREQVGGMWAYADTMGMDVVMVTDMLALTAPLEDYLGGLPGGLDADSEQLWDVYRAGADELLGGLPYVDGIMIRVGEAGAVYNLDGWDYYSALEVTGDDQLRRMVRTFTDVAAEHDADVYLRSWSVGVGEVGDVHTNPDTYDRLLGDLGPEQGVDNLVVSTKFAAGDFDSRLPLNPTLLSGPQQRIVEIQARREFEGSGAFPNDTTGEHAAALQAVDAANPRLDGVWVWTQSGGPQRAGPMSLYLTAGFWQQWDLQVWTSARLAWDPDADHDEMERAWLRRTWSQDPTTVAALSDLLAASRQAVRDGLYVGPYAEQEVRAFGLEPPPMLWIFKWDLVGGDTATWSALYEASRGRVEEAVAGGEQAVAQVEAMQATLAGTDRSTFTDPAAHDALTRSLAYERDLFLTLGSYRETMLRAQQWVDTRDPADRADFEQAAAGYREQVLRHERTWAGDLDLPPYEFGAADTGLDRIAGDARSTWLARGLLVLAGLALAALPLLRRSALLPWRLEGASWTGAGRTGRVATLLLPVVVVLGAHAAFGSLTSPWWTVLACATAVATVVGSLLVGALAHGAPALGRASCRTGGGGGPAPAPGLLVAVVAGPQLVGVLPLLAATAWRGPVGAWSGFWLEPGARAAYVLAATVALVWLLVAPALSGVMGERRTSVSLAAGSVGTALLLLGGLLLVMGQERLLTVLNDELQVVPAGLSRILGLTVHLGVPEQLPTAVLAAGAAAWVLALLLLLRGTDPAADPGGPGTSRRRRPTPAPARCQPDEPSAVSASASQSAST